jgi:transcriptional regulator with XRE-family HTH domain
MHLADRHVQVLLFSGWAAVSPGPSPLVQRRRLRTELRTARQEVGLTQEAVADEMDWSLSKVIRIETGAVGISTNDLQALLRLYGIRDPLRVRDLVALGRAARKPTWWSKYREFLNPIYFQYIEYETAASIIRSHETIAVPGLLQTEEYAAILAQGDRTNHSARTARALVEVRIRRQEMLLSQDSSPLAFFILDEAVIRRLVGEREVAREQLRKLMDMAARPHVTIEIVPFSAGLNRGMFENFSILEFDEPGDHDVMYFESARESILSHDEAGEISIYRELFEDLRAASLGPEGSRDYLEHSFQEAS